MSVIISAQEAKEKLTNKNTIFVDVRTKEEGFSSAREAYLDHHIPGAIFLHIKEEITGKDSFFRPANEIAETLGMLGIDRGTEIIFYDQGNHRAAAKAWVALYYLGHEKILVLDGGLPGWKRAGGVLTDEVTTYAAKCYEPSVQKRVVQTIDEIKKKHLSPEIALIDSRAYDRFTGEVEPKYKKAGHIPGAVNFHAKHVFSDSGTWKSEKILKSHFESLQEKEEIIVSCGSGNSACLNVVALVAAGFDNVALYPGGFSEWINDDENEVAIGEE